jgi:hypothetical protein
MIDAGPEGSSALGGWRPCHATPTSRPLHCPGVRPADGQDRRRTNRDARGDILRATELAGSPHPRSRRADLISFQAGGRVSGADGCNTDRRLSAGKLSRSDSLPARRWHV